MRAPDRDDPHGIALDDEPHALLRADLVLAPAELFEASGEAAATPWQIERGTVGEVIPALAQLGPAFAEQQTPAFLRLRVREDEFERR